MVSKPIFSVLRLLIIPNVVSKPFVELDRVLTLLNIIFCYLVYSFSFILVILCGEWKIYWHCGERKIYFVNSICFIPYLAKAVNGQQRCCQSLIKNYIRDNNAIFNEYIIVWNGQQIDYNRMEVVKWMETWFAYSDKQSEGDILDVEWIVLIMIISFSWSLSSTCCWSRTTSNGQTWNK